MPHTASGHFPRRYCQNHSPGSPDLAAGRFCVGRYKVTAPADFPHLQILVPTDFRFSWCLQILRTQIFCAEVSTFRAQVQGLPVAAKLCQCGRSSASGAARGVTPARSGGPLSCSAASMAITRSWRGGSAGPRCQSRTTSSTARSWRGGRGWRRARARR